ncbi:MAG: hypothetical protein AB7D50_01375 [Bacilli bacterium]|jgi:fluoroquinolone transport system permease protein
MHLQILFMQIKRILRDKMYIFFALYPLFIVALSYWLIPYLRTEAGDIAANVVVLLLILMTPFMFGALTAFTLLDDRDDHVFTSLRITPLKITTYINIKLVIAYLFGVISSLLVLFINDYLSMSVLDKILVALLSSMSAPTIALLVNAFSTNKVEGFVILKSTGLLIILPIAALFVTSWTEIFLGIIPGFWPARIITLSLLPTDFLMPNYLYFIIGTLINLIYIFVFYRIFLKKR